MPPIPIHLNDPINSNTTTAAAPDGITPQTNPPPTRTTPLTAPATTTSSPPAPAPQPGARPVPTSTTTPSSPPAPQPGAVPTAPNTYLPRTITKVHTTTETHAPPPPQTSLPPPSDSQLAGKSTLAYTPANIPQGVGPTTLPLGGQYTQGGPSPIERPPGYVQNQRAFEDPPELREAARREEGEGGLMSVVKGAGESLRKGEEAVWKWVGGKAG